MNLTELDRLHIKTFLIVCALISTTTLSIYLFYGSEYFIKWPWFKFSLIMSILTVLWTYTFWFFRIANLGKVGEASLFLVIPFNFILLYPGAEALGIWSDSVGQYLLYVLIIQHGLGGYMIERSIKKYLADLHK